MYLHAAADQAAHVEGPHHTHQRQLGLTASFSSLSGCTRAWQRAHSTALRVQDGGDKAAVRPKLAQPAHAVQRWNTPSPDEEDAADLLLARQQAPFADREHAFTVRASC